jgi:hypothetical protein
MSTGLKVDLDLWIEGIRGDSMTFPYIGWIPVFAHWWRRMNEQLELVADEYMQWLTVETPVGIHSAPLFTYCSAGAHLSQVSLSVLSGWRLVISFDLSDLIVCNRLTLGGAHPRERWDLARI